MKEERVDLQRGNQNVEGMNSRGFMNGGIHAEVRGVIINNYKGDAVIGGTQ